MTAPPGEPLRPAAPLAHLPGEPPPLPATSTGSEVVSGASRRLRALSALSGSLTDALDPEEAANLVERKALSALGATSAIVVTLGPFPPPPASVPVTEQAAPVLWIVHAAERSASEAAVAARAVAETAK